MVTDFEAYCIKKNLHFQALGLPSYVGQTPLIIKMYDKEVIMYHLIKIKSRLVTSATMVLLASILLVRQSLRPTIG